MKLIAMYLPQFHQVKENDRWWGHGFTEWTAVKNANKLYKEHYQPHIPQSENYYNLLDKNTMQWQEKLMKKYNVDGLCMYHYWFKDGKKILEKPAENLLKWKDINIPYCFCWANETWARTWGNLQNRNVWVNTCEIEDSSDTDNILLEQKYGNEKDWREHFQYLLPFFLDDRYIKVNGKPLYMIYMTADIPCLAEMLDCWRNLAIKHGLKGLYIIGSGCKYIREKCLDAEIYREPARSLSLLHKTSVEKNGVSTFDYDIVWETILKTEFKDTTYFQGVVGYDNTPRRGKEGSVIESANPSKFTHYLTELMAKSVANGNELVFINAWNEWGEGMCLEPEEKYGEEFLAAIPYAKKNYVSLVEKYKKMNAMTKLDDIVDLQREQWEKNSYYLKLLDRWMTLRENGFSINKWLSNAGYKNIALYGYGTMGRHFYDELQGGSIKICFIIDQQKNRLHLKLPVYLPSDSIPNVDAVIVSSTYYYDEIYYLLKKKKVEKIISLETILNEN